MSKKVPEILWIAQRQYRHNSGDDELIFGFDQGETVEIVESLQKRVKELEEECPNCGSRERSYHKTTGTIKSLCFHEWHDNTGEVSDE